MTLSFRALRRKNQWEELVRVCDRLAASSDLPHKYWAFTQKASACAELGREREALDALSRVSPDNLMVQWKHDLRLKRVEVLNRLGAYARAAAEGEELLAVQTTPNDLARVRYVLTNAYLGLKQFDKAEAALREVLEYDPDDALALNNLGYHLADEGRKLPEAEVLIRRAIALNRDVRARAGNPVTESGVYLDSLGWVLFRRGKLAEAKAAFERAVTDPDGAADPLVWDHFGDVLYKLGEKEQARAAWKKAEPGYAVGRQGREGGRKEELQRKLALFP
jgi:tetratricopeptide (TPR) repeat protein